MDKKIVYNTIDEYIAGFPPELQCKLQDIRSEIRRNVPEAVEKISYGMPAFYLNGNLVYFAAFKNHIGFFPTQSGVNAFRSELKGYDLSKGTIRIPLGSPLPLDLIGRIARFRAQENAANKKK